mgnify:FL=1
MTIHQTLQNDFAQALAEESPSRLRFDEPMDRHTSFRIGGPADAFFEPDSIRAVEQALRFCKNRQISCTIVGNGSNLLVSDQGIRGLVLAVGDSLSGIERQDDVLLVMAGTRLSALAAFAARQELTGLEFASGIPGTLGGAIQMNAGAYDGCMQDVVRQTDFVDEDLACRQINGEEHQFAYRHSAFSERSAVILRARLELNPGSYGAITAKMNDLAERRRQSQPLEWPSAGSVFKRPPGFYAGKLISDCQLKGYSIGDAQVSEKHAGFIVNRGAATARDVLRLIEHIQMVVSDKTGVWLEPEIKCIGDWTA